MSAVVASMKPIRTIRTVTYRVSRKDFLHLLKLRLKHLRVGVRGIGMDTTASFLSFPIPKKELSFTDLNNIRHSIETHNIECQGVSERNKSVIAEFGHMIVFCEAAIVGLTHSPKLPISLVFDINDEALTLYLSDTISIRLKLVGFSVP